MKCLYAKLSTSSASKSIWIFWHLRKYPASSSEQRDQGACMQRRYSGRYSSIDSVQQWWVHRSICGRKRYRGHMHAKIMHAPSSVNFQFNCSFQFTNSDLALPYLVFVCTVKRSTSLVIDSPPQLRKHVCISQIIFSRTRL